MTFIDKTACKQLAKKLEDTDSELNKVFQTLQAKESELDNAQMELETAHQEIKILAQNINLRN